MKHFVLYFVLLSMTPLLRAQEYYDDERVRLENYVYEPQVKTVQLFRSGAESSYPILELNSNEQLFLSFDVLDGSLGNYDYTFIHCDANWQQSQLADLEFMQGMLTDLMQNYEFSRNPRQAYIHYDLAFPNENIQLTQSGNYVLLVRDLDKDQAPVLTMRFMVYEKIVSVAGRVNQANRSEYRFEKQEVDFSLFTADLPIVDPYRNIKVAVLQNNRWDNAIVDLKPRFVKGAELEYNYNKENLFDGGNEFRILDVKNLNYRSLGVQRIAFENDTSRFYMDPSERRSAKSYLFWEDVNGRFFIRNDDRSWDDRIDSDYALVYLTLPVDFPFANTDIFVFGQLSYWTYRPENKMRYNPNRKQYELELYLKQGYYNYQYIAVPNNSNRGDVALIEGNHSAAENEYAVLTYFRGPNDIFDRMVGFEVLNSRR